MDHGGEAARTTAAGSTELRMAGAVRGSETNVGSGAFDGQLGAAAARPGSFSDFDLSAVAGRGELPVDVLSHLHQEPGPDGVAYPNDIGASWRQLGSAHVVLVGPHLPGGVVPVHGSYGYYSALQPRPGRGVVLGDLLPRGFGEAAEAQDDYGYYALQPRPGAGHGDGEVLGAGHGEVFVGYDNYDYYALLPRPGAGHGEVFLGLLPGGVGAAHDDYGYYPRQPRPGVGRGEVFIGPLPDEIAGALRDPNLGAGYDGSVTLADDLGAEYNNRGMVADHLRRLLPFAGIGACSVAVNGLAAAPGSPTAAFHLFVLLLGGLFLVTLHVLRV